MKSYPFHPGDVIDLKGHGDEKVTKIEVAQIEIIPDGVVHHQKAICIQSLLQAVQLSALPRAPEAQEQVLFPAAG